MLGFSYLIIMNIKVFQEEFSTADKIIMHLVKIDLLWKGTPLENDLYTYN